jgi:hypothetical protein
MVLNLIHYELGWLRRMLVSQSAPPMPLPHPATRRLPMLTLHGVHSEGIESSALLTYYHRSKHCGNY